MSELSQKELIMTVCIYIFLWDIGIVCSKHKHKPNCNVWSTSMRRRKVAETWKANGKLYGVKLNVFIVSGMVFVVVVCFWDAATNYHPLSSFDFWTITITDEHVSYTWIVCLSSSNVRRTHAEHTHTKSPALKRSINVLMFSKTEFQLEPTLIHSVYYYIHFQYHVHVSMLVLVIV